MFGNNMEKNEIDMRYNPDEPKELDKIIRGSYDDFVRPERRNLLVTSAIIMISFHASIKPESVNQSGFSFPDIDTRMFFGILTFTCLYFLVAYIVYAYPNFRESKINWKALKSKAMKITGNKHRFPIEVQNHLSNARYFLWIFINYILPVIAGISASIIGAFQIV